MIVRLTCTPAGERDFRKLPHQVQARIVEKLQVYLASGTPLSFAKPLVNLPPATHRVEGSSLVIDGVNTREDAYRRR